MIQAKLLILSKLELLTDPTGDRLGNVGPVIFLVNATNC